MPNLRHSIQHLLYLSKPLPRSITDELRLSHRHLLKLHDQFIDIASEMQIWTFYETIDSQLSGLGTSDLDEVHFSAPIASIKSSLVGSRNEQSLSLESEHAKCASFGPDNIETMYSYLVDLSQAVGKAERLSYSFVHTPLRLGENVKLELIGFYDDPNPDSASDIRLYVSKHYLDEFLNKGPEYCLKERLNTIAPKLRHGQTLPVSQSRAFSPGGTGALGILGNGQGLGQRILGGASPLPSEGSPVAAEGIQGLQSPDIVITRDTQRPQLSEARFASEPAISSRPMRGLTVPSLTTPGFNRPGTGDRTDSDETTKTLGEAAETEISPLTKDPKAPLEPDITSDVVSDIDDDDDLNPGADGRGGKPAPMQDPSAGFSRPDPQKRKFMWIHMPYNNPHWVKVCDQ